MTNFKIADALQFLGFSSGWVCSDTEIVLWENSEPQPTKKQLDDAMKQLATTQVAAQDAKAEARQAVLDKLGLTADEAAALLG
jgi:hypothetical protein